MSQVIYPMTLSVTDRNHVGEIMVRQSDDNTQVFKVNQITENGEVKTFEGLTPFFCLFPRGTTGQGLTEEPVQVFDGKKGTLSYTLSPNAWQYIGKNEAYFSFRKQLDNGMWDEQFSTKMFIYKVQKSIHQVEFKDSNYWWTFKELLEKFRNGIDSAKSYWENFLESVRTTIESIDGGGNVLEIAEFKFSKLFNKWFENMKNRVDFIDQIIAENGVTPTMFGAIGDGIKDDTEAIQNMVNFAAKNGLVARTPRKTFLIKAHVDREQPFNRTFLKNEGGVLLPSNLKMVCEGTIFKAMPTQDFSYNILRTWGSDNVSITGDLTLVGEADTHIGEDGEWGFGLAIFGGENPYFEGIKAKNFWGDGFLTDVKGEDAFYPVKNMTMIDCHSKNNGRQGMSLQGNDGFYAKNCSFKGSYRTAPMAGVDCEPWHSDNIMKNIVFEECDFSNNKGNGFLSYGQYNEIKLINCTGVNNVKSLVEAYRTKKLTLENMSLDNQNIQLVNVDEFISRNLNLKNSKITTSFIENFVGTKFLFDGGFVETTGTFLGTVFSANGFSQVIFNDIDGFNTSSEIVSLLSSTQQSLFANRINIFNFGRLGFTYAKEAILNDISAYNLKTELLAYSSESLTIKKTNLSGIEKATDKQVLRSLDIVNLKKMKITACDFDTKAVLFSNKNDEAVYNVYGNTGTSFKSSELPLQRKEGNLIETRALGITRYANKIQARDSVQFLPDQSLFVILIEGGDPPYGLYYKETGNQIYKLSDKIATLT